MRSARTSKATKKAPKAGAASGLDPMLASVAMIMTKRVASVRPDTSLDSAMELLMSKDISHLPVVDDGELVGVLSKTDLVRERFLNGMNEERETLKVSDRRGGSYSMGAGFHEDADSGRMVSDLMSSKVRTVTSAATVAEAAIAMTKFRVHGLPVVNDGGRLVGFVSTLDVVRWVAQSLE